MKPIDEIKIKKTKLENDIYQLLNQFKIETGVIPTNIDIQTVMDLTKDGLGLIINNVKVNILLD